MITHTVGLASVMVCEDSGDSTVHTLSHVESVKNKSSIVVQIKQTDDLMLTQANLCRTSQQTQ